MYDQKNRREAFSIMAFKRVNPDGRVKPPHRMKTKIETDEPRPEFEDKPKKNARRKSQRVSFANEQHGISLRRELRKKDKEIKAVLGKKMVKLPETMPIKLLITDWAIRYGDASPSTYLNRIRGYNDHEVKSIMSAHPASQWYKERVEVLDGMSEQITKRHIDWVAEMHDSHMKSSKLGLNAAYDFLTHETTKPASQKDIRMIKVALEAIQVAQKIQRTTLGLPQDEGSVHVFNQLFYKQQAKDDIPEDEKTEVQKVEEMLTIDDIKMLVEVRREEKRIKIEENTIDAEVSH